MMNHGFEIDERLPRVPLDEAAGKIEVALRATPSDYMIREEDVTVDIRGPNSPLILLRYGQPDSRRSVEPLEFTSTKCFCDHAINEPSKWFPISDVSAVFLLDDRAHQFASQCGPEPLAGHYADMVELSIHLSRSSLHSMTVVNLPGSGASVPQHFHTQIYSLEPRAAAGQRLRDNSLTKLWGNVQSSNLICTCSDGTQLHEIVSPHWGLRITFTTNIAGRDIGEVLHAVIQRDLRYRSQLALSYNLYLDSATPRSITILFRESCKERVFQLPEIHALIECFADKSAALRIAASPNRFWRWAWLEVIGGLPARDDSFADTQVFGWEFWQAVWSLIALKKSYQLILRERVIHSLPLALYNL